MTAERFEAFKRAQLLIGQLAPAKLHSDEEFVLRDAAEGLLLCSGPESPEADRYRQEAREQLRALVDSGRWLQETAERLERFILDCCPDLAGAAALAS